MAKLYSEDDMRAEKLLFLCLFFEEKQQVKSGNIRISGSVSDLKKQVRLLNYIAFSFQENVACCKRMSDRFECNCSFQFKKK